MADVCSAAGRAGIQNEELMLQLDHQGVSHDHDLYLPHEKFHFVKVSKELFGDYEEKSDDLNMKFAFPRCQLLICPILR